MTSFTPLFDLAMTAIVALAVYIAAWALNGIFANLAEKLPPHWQESLDHSGQYILRGRISFVEVFSWSMPLGFVAAAVAFASGGPVLLGPALVLATLGLPLVVVSHSTARYRKALEDVLPAALQQVANERAAGRSLESALEAAAETAPSPANIELGALHRKIAAMGTEKAIEDTAQKLQVKSFSLAASVLTVGAKRGGDLADALKRLSTTLVEIQRMNRKIATASAAGRRLIWLLSILSLAFPVAWYSYGPQKLGDVIQHPVGQGMLFLAFVIWCIALGIVFVIMRVKV